MSGQPRLSPESLALIGSGSDTLTARSESQSPGTHTDLCPDRFAVWHADHR